MSFPPVDYDVALETLSHEGLVRQTYLDSKGVPTWSVGVTSRSGHSVERYYDNPQPMDYCLQVYVWLLRGSYTRDVEAAFKGFTLTKSQFAAALSFHWNTGAIKRAAWVALFKAGKMAQAEAAFMRYSKPPEIMARRKKEADLLFRGRWSNDGRITEYTQVSKSHHIVWSSARRVNIEAALRAALAGDGAPAAAPVSLISQVAPDDAPAIAVPAAGDEIVQSTAGYPAVQQDLKGLGYYDVGIVGDTPGGKTVGAIAAFRLDRGIGGPAVVDDALVLEIAKAKGEGWHRPIADARAQASTQTVAERVPEAKAAKKGVLASWWATFSGGVLTAAAFAKDNISAAKDYITPVTDLAGPVPGWVMIGGVAVALFALYKINASTQDKISDAYRSGERS